MVSASVARSAVALLLILLLPLAAPAGPDTPFLAGGHVTRLRSLAKSLARAQLGSEAEVVVDALEALGYDRKKAAKLREECDRTFHRSRPGDTPRAARRSLLALREAVNALAAGLPRVADESERRRLAAALVDLDPDCAPARLALGHVGVHGSFYPPDLAACAEGRARYLDALRRARKLPLEIDVVGPADEMFQKASGMEGHTVRCGNVFVVGTRGRERLRRILRRGVQGAVVVNQILTGDMDVPQIPPVRYVLLDSREMYLRAVRLAARSGRLDGPGLEEAEQLSGYHLNDGVTYLNWACMDTDAAAVLLYRITSETGWGDGGRSFPSWQASLSAGLLEYACRSFLGTGMPRFAFHDRYDEFERRTLSDPGAARRKNILRLARAGLSGNRRWLIELVREEKDPPWGTTMQDQIGKIVGTDLMKTTSVIRFLSEQRPLLPIFLATTAKRSKELDVPFNLLLEKELGRSLSELEVEWRRWLLPPLKKSLAEKLAFWDGGPARRREEDRLMGRLTRIRRRAGLGTIEHCDDELSEGARRHARYLALNPGQQSVWPGAHEEYDDREGFTTEGAWAGLRSVIAFGKDGPEAAIASWMGTFYHRLPLLDPGLVGVGWALESGVAVLDVGSFVEDVWGDFTILWPPAGMEDVPRSMVPELPNPVPGTDQSGLGYPITLQLHRPNAVLPAVLLTLTRSAKNGEELEVACHFTEPEAPLNPALAPENAWCLLPKQPLSPKTRYRVTAEFSDRDDPIVWSFTTGE